MNILQLKVKDISNIILIDKKAIYKLFHVISNINFTNFNSRYIFKKKKNYKLQ